MSVRRATQMLEVWGRCERSASGARDKGARITTTRTTDDGRRTSADLGSLLLGVPAALY